MSVELRNNITLLRKKTGENQSSIAYELGLKRTTYANYESGHSEPNVEALIKISSFYGINLDDLLLKDLTDGKILDEIWVRGLDNQKGKILGKMEGEVSGNFNIFSKNSILSKRLTRIRENIGINEDYPSANVYDIYGRGDEQLSELLQDFNKLKQYPMIYVPGLSEGLHVRLKISMDSMHPTIKLDDYVIATHQPKPTTTLSGGQIFLIVDSQNDLLFNRVHYHEEYIATDTVEFDGMEYLLESDNYRYKELKRNIIDFKTVFKVVEVQTRNMSNVEAVKLKMFDQFRQEIEALRRKKAKS